MRIVPHLTAMSFLTFGPILCGQTISAPVPQTAHIAGTVTDANGDIVPGAMVTVEGGTGGPQSVVANDNGFFEDDNVVAGVSYRITVSAKGFADWMFSPVVLSPGQFDLLRDINLTILGGDTSVTVFASPEALATEQVKIEEHQRVLGFIPNFYVSYDKNAVALTPKLKFELALKVAIDPVTLAGTAFLAASDQASHYPHYVEGFSGYGQRFGAVYLNGLTDIMVGGAILPSVLHQDPRYFYQGTGSTKARLLHALSSPIVCRRDSGGWTANYSSLGGYLASGAVANAYYPVQNRGANLLFRIFAVDLSANIANGVLQEFLLRKLTPSAKDRN
jgi:Carboxypeptidase regulatory-like domain